MTGPGVISLLVFGRGNASDSISVPKVLAMYEPGRKSRISFYHEENNFVSRKYVVRTSQADN